MEQRATENSALLGTSATEARRIKVQEVFTVSFIVVQSVCLMFWIGAQHRALQFPANFIWGVATSAYQIEGAAHIDGRGDSIWDTFVKKNGTVIDGSTGDVADDHYHRHKEDVQLLVNLGVSAYRFSISWPRVIPNGTGSINERGLQFYNDLIDELLRYNIEPYITLFHWDLPDALQSTGGWMDPATIDAFVAYADVIFDRYAGKVSSFITVNEPWT